MASAFAAAAGVVIMTAAQAAAPDLHPCKQLKTARCGTLSVFENRAAKTGRKISINVLVIPAPGPALAEPIFWLSGGPGEAASDEAQDIVGDRTREILRVHDIVSSISAAPDRPI